MKSKQKDDDRRNCFRAPVKTKVYLNDEESEGLIYFYTENLSIGGVFLITDLLMAKGDKVSLVFNLPQQDDIVRARGEVVWIRDETDSDFDACNPGMGVRFIDLNPEYKKCIQKFIDRYADKERLA